MNEHSHWWGEYKDNNTGVTSGKLCKECSRDKECNDKLCPLYKFRKG